MMGLQSFAALFPDIGHDETRTVAVLKAADHLPPPDDYGFDEWYCVDPECDCRRVLVAVLARHDPGQAATINYAFEKPPTDALVPEQLFLDPLGPQRPYAPQLLELFKAALLADAGYVARLHRHYDMVKKKVGLPQRAPVPFRSPRPFRKRKSR